MTGRPLTVSRIGRLALFVVVLGLPAVVGQVRSSAGLSVTTTQTTPVTAPRADIPTPTLAPGTGAVAGTTWQDLNRDGVRDAGEPRLAGVQLTLADRNGEPLLTTNSDSEGAYRFSALSPGSYQVTAIPPPGYVSTTPSTQVFLVLAQSVVVLDFGVMFNPTATPTPTPAPRIDVDNAQPAVCGGFVQGDTHTGVNRVSMYSCRPYWLETGPELVYRIQLAQGQTLSAQFLVSATDHDLFLLPSSDPATCLAAGDNGLSVDLLPGTYFLVVDGYQGAAGQFQMRLDCPLEVQATATPTFTPSPTPTASATRPPSPTPTHTPTIPPKLGYLPLISRSSVTSTPIPVTVVFQAGADGYTGAADTWLSAWEPQPPLGKYGSATRLYLRLNRQTAQTTHMAPLLRFDLTELAAGVHVVEAHLRLYLLEPLQPLPPPQRDLVGASYGMLRAWDEQTANWLESTPGQPWGDYGAQGAGTDHMSEATDRQVILEPNRWYDFDVTTLTQLWVSNPERNAGMVLLAELGDSGTNTEARFASREYEDLTFRPQLVVSYWVTEGAVSR